MLMLVLMLICAFSRRGVFFRPRSARFGGPMARVRLLMHARHTGVDPGGGLDEKAKEWILSSRRSFLHPIPFAFVTAVFCRSLLPVGIFTATVGLAVPGWWSIFNGQK